MEEAKKFESDVSALAMQMLAARTRKYRDKGMSWKMGDLRRTAKDNDAHYSSSLDIRLFDRDGKPVVVIDHMVYKDGKPVATIDELKRLIKEDLEDETGNC